VRRLSLILAVAILAGTALAFTGAGPRTIPSAAGAVCPVGQNQAFVTLHSRLTWLHYRETYLGGGITSISGRQTILNGVAAGRITYTFCVGFSSVTGWTIRRAPDVIEYAYYGMDSGLHVTRGTAFALRAAVVNSKSLTVEPTRCRSWAGGLEFAKFILSLPLPGLHYAVAVGKYLLGAAIPAGSTSCQAFASATVRISFNRLNGNTTAVARSATYYHTVQIKTGNCVTPPIMCWDVDEYRWSIYP
jgi:hypothetical protein